MTRADTDIADRLGEHEFFKGMPNDYIRALAPLTSEKIFQAGEHINRGGGEANACYFIEDGHVGIEIHDPARGSVKVQTLNGGDVFGWSSLMEPYRWTFDAIAYEDSRVLVIDAAGLRQVMESNCGLGYEVLKRFNAVFSDRLKAARLQMLNLFDA